MATREEIETLLMQPTITPDQFLQTKVMPIGRSTLYDAINSGEIAAMKVGKKKLILTAPLRKQLGI